MSQAKTRSAKAARRKALEHQFAAPVADPVPVHEKTDANPLGRVQSYLQKPVLVQTPGVEQPVVRREETDWPLDTCPLCDGEAEYEYMGTLYPHWSVVCQKCFCSTQSYGSKYWAAWRWNTRPVQKVFMPKKPDDIPENDYYEEDNEALEKPAPEPVKPEPVEDDNEDVKIPPRKPRDRRRVIKDLPNQMIFVFMSNEG